MEWFKTHIFIAAWASPTIALIGLLIKKSVPGELINWSRVMIYVGFLTALAVIVTPGIEPAARVSMNGLAAIAFGYLIVDSAWKK